MAAIVACLGAVISPTPRVPSAAQRARIHPAPASRPTLPLRINGTWYDASAYALKHEGGRWLLEYARGRDVTALFRATHLFGETRAASHLATLPVLPIEALRLPSRAGLSPRELLREAAGEAGGESALQGPYVIDERPGRAPADMTTPAPLPHIDSPLRAELQAMLRRRFPTRRSMKATPAHWARTAVAAALCAQCWVGWYHLNPIAVLLLPLAQWLLAAHTVHEATHGALSTNPTVNYWAQFTAHPILFNVFVWIPQHLLSHHQYTNDPHHDVDLHHFAPARLANAQPAPARLANAQPAAAAAASAGASSAASSFNEAWTFVWKGCLTTLGTSILQPLRTLTEKPTPNFDSNLTPVPAAVSKRTLLLSMVPSFLVLLYPTLAATFAGAPLVAAAWATAWPWIGMSLIWTAMTQTSHVQASTQPEDADGDCWTARQIGTALDYSMGDPMATALTAGLNSQGLHHAMPQICSCHFPAIYEEYAQICQRHGVTPRQTANLRTACQEMFEYVFELNAPRDEAHSV